MKKKKKGITLLEVIISFAIFAILLIPLANVVLTATKFNKESEIKQQAKIAGQKAIEEVKQIDNFDPSAPLDPKKIKKLPSGAEIAPKDPADSKNTEYEYTKDKSEDEYKVKGTIKILEQTTHLYEDILKDKYTNMIYITNDDIRGVFGQPNTELSKLVNLARVGTTITYSTPRPPNTKPTPNDINIEIRAGNVLKVNGIDRGNINSALVIYLEQPRELSKKINIDIKDDVSNNELFIFRNENKVTADQFRESINENITLAGGTTGGTNVFRNIPLRSNFKNDGLYSIELKIIKKHPVEKEIENIRSEFNFY